MLPARYNLIAAEAVRPATHTFQLHVWRTDDPREAVRFVQLVQAWNRRRHAHEGTHALTRELRRSLAGSAATAYDFTKHHTTTLNDLGSHTAVDDTAHLVVAMPDPYARTREESLRAFREGEVIHTPVRGGDIARAVMRGRVPPTHGASKYLAQPELVLQYVSPEGDETIRPVSAFQLPRDVCV